MWLIKERTNLINGDKGIEVLVVIRIHVYLRTKWLIDKEYIAGLNAL